MKVILKNLLASLLLLLFMIATLGLYFNALSEVVSMPATWEFIGFAVLPLTTAFTICGYKEGK